MSEQILALALALAAGSPWDGRLVGHTVRDGAIVDIAGEGAPRVGVIERRGAELWLRGEGEWRLVGPLAHPRIAGPGYQVWVLGPVEDGALHARRLGVLRPK